MKFKFQVVQTRTKTLSRSRYAHISLATFGSENLRDGPLDRTVVTEGVTFGKSSDTLLAAGAVWASRIVEGFEDVESVRFLLQPPLPKVIIHPGQSYNVRDRHGRVLTMPSGLICGGKLKMGLGPTLVSSTGWR